MERVENIVKKGENAGYQHFLLYRQCFPRPSLSGLLKVGILWYRIKSGKSLFDFLPKDTQLFFGENEKRSPKVALTAQNQDVMNM